MITFVSREKREIVGHKVSENKNAETLQKVADKSPAAANYHSDGHAAYAKVCYPGIYFSHHDKTETYTVEGVNSDLRKYIPGFARCSKCFYRKIETVCAVMAVFVRAFNIFASAKFQTRKLAVHMPTSKSKKLHKYKDSPLALIDFF